MLAVSQKIQTEINETDFSYFQFLRFQNCRHFLQLVVKEGFFEFSRLNKTITVKFSSLMSSAAHAAALPASYIQARFFLQAEVPALFRDRNQVRH